MRALRFLTWLDIRRLIREKTYYGSKLPDGITYINCFSDALEVNLKSFDYLSKAESELKDWFGDWYQSEQSLIQLDLGDSTLPVEFLVDESPDIDSVPIRPFWEEIAYISDQSNSDTTAYKQFYFPEYDSTLPSLISFYSFKGGVGRTVHFAAYLFALLDCAKELEKPITILVIDADLEAPGLTYWDKKEGQQPTVSFIDFLESYHYSSLPIEQTLDIFATEVKKSPKRQGESIFYFLPACLSDDQLLDTPILPEHLTRSHKGVWTFSDAIYQLGSTLNVDYIMVDLRAGLSEISSPLIFDPRVQRFFVTTAAEQSVAGLSLVLKQISHVAPPEPEIDNNQYFDPSIIVSFLTRELKSLPEFQDALVQFRDAYSPATDSEEASIYSKRLVIEETDFSQNLLYINTWEEAKEKLSDTSVMEVAKSWASSQLKQAIQVETSEETSQSSSLYSIDQVERFRNTCERYEYAESGSGESLLITETLKNLASNFRNSLPRVVSLGAKGAGKTFIYVQLSRLKYWQDFLNIALKEDSASEAYIFPLLQSENLQDNAKNIIHDAREEVRNKLGDNTPTFFYSDYKERILESLENNLTELDWSKFWEGEIAKSIGMNDLDDSKLQDISAFLKSKDSRIIFLFDGLEDIFTEVASNNQQKLALKALINLPAKLSEVRQANLGLIILLRRDFLRYAITQNSGQFESLYKPYDLFWNTDSFLKLVYWVCSQADVIGAKEDNVDKLGREGLISELEKLWGDKLGGSREARTASWVYAALTDFTGRLQARDIVRLLFHAAKITVDESQRVQFEKWSLASPSRLLPPKAIRDALVPCSKEKVKEAKEEYPEFKDWAKKIEEEYSLEQKRIPFKAENLGLDQSTIRMLESMGVIYEDSGKDDGANYYMPDIFYTGLGFTLGKRGRPRVLALKRKALGQSTL